MIAPRKQGYTLIEMVLYSALLALVSIFVVTSILRLGGSYAKTRALRRLNEIGDVAMERMIREIRLGKVVSAALSDDLAIQREISSVAVDYEFARSNGRLTLAVDGGAPVFVTPDTVTVTRLQFTHLCAPANCPAEPALVSEGVRIEMNATTGSGSAVASTTYIGFVLLRDSYAAD